MPVKDLINAFKGWCEATLSRAEAPGTQAALVLNHRFVRQNVFRDDRAVTLQVCESRWTMYAL
jgi:hypothetical protein